MPPKKKATSTAAPASKAPAKPARTSGRTSSLPTTTMASGNKRKADEDSSDKPTAKKTRTNTPAPGKENSAPENTIEGPEPETKPKKAKAGTKAAGEAAPTAPKKLAATSQKAVSTPDPEPAAKKLVSMKEKPAKFKTSKAPEKAEYSGTIAQFKNLLKGRGLKQSGTKDELIARLEADDANPRPELNAIPTELLDLYAFGEGSAGELGLGSIHISKVKKVTDVTRPRLNPNLLADKIGVVFLATGGMHCAALTRDNKILTWGVGEGGALGREHESEGKLVDAKDDDSDSDSDDDDDKFDPDSGLNPLESNPRQVDPRHFPEGTKFVSLACSDSATYALTTTGKVYGWGHFRDNEGPIGFRPHVPQQDTPVFIDELKNIVAMECGANHVLALDNKGQLFTWGAAEQGQLGKRIVSRFKGDSLAPIKLFGVNNKRKTITMGCGEYHSFAVADDGKVYSWGLNTSGQLGLPIPETFEGCIIGAQEVTSLRAYKVKQIKGGAHHSVAITQSGEVLVWGNIRSGQAGIEFDDLPEEAIGLDDHDEIAYLTKPVHVATGLGPDGEAVDIIGKDVALGPDTCLVVTEDGKAFSWGFSVSYNTGQNTTKPVMEAKIIENTATRGKKLIYARAGGQFGMLVGKHEDTVMAQ